MSNNKNLPKLTTVQREILTLLKEGGIMTIDSINSAFISNREVAPSTRYTLTDKRLVARLDKTKAVTTKGNGYVSVPRE